MKTRTISWFSCGAASAVATKLQLKEGPVDICYCDTGAEHPDNARFLKDCEKWFGQKVIILKSEKYKDTWDVWEQRKYLSGVKGAPCTSALKMEQRLKYQRPTDIHIFGYTADKTDKTRAERLRKSFFDLNIRTPLIERGLTKRSCLGLIKRAGIQLPVMYLLGFSNNNCIPCVKGTAPSYWSAQRKFFPTQFKRMAKLSRKLGVRLCEFKGERIFIDEIPLDYPTKNPLEPSCGFICQAIEDEEL